jgi:hypothetical protein
MELYWAIYTWMLFHTLIEKTDDMFYTNKYREIFNLIINVCNELPCIICRQHAKNYLNSINISQLTTREQFKRMLFDFHNNVNSRVGNPQYHYNNLLNYKNYNMSTILVNFRRFFSKPYGGVLQIGLQSNRYKRINVTNMVFQWFGEHWYQFNH